jgi:methionine-rich copper-binding protein CopC
MNNVSLVIIGIIIISVSTISHLGHIEVFGHANPVLYIPPSNSVFQLDQSLPNNITIFYSERPEPKISYIHVLNSQNERIDNNDFKIVGKDERGASVTLDSTKLDSGTYTISWLVLSKDDGHITKGSYVFTITDPLSTTTTTTTNITKDDVNRFLEKTIIDQVNLEYEITPLIAGGINTFTVILKDENNKPLSNVKNVIMQFNNQEQNIGPIIANLNNTDNGVYNTTGAYLSQEGEWNIKITVQRTGEYDLNHSFDIVVPSK